MSDSIDDLSIRGADGPDGITVRFCDLAVGFHHAFCETLRRRRHALLSLSIVVGDDLVMSQSDHLTDGRKCGEGVVAVISCSVIRAICSGSLAFKDPPESAPLKFR